MAIRLTKDYVDQTYKMARQTLIARGIVAVDGSGEGSVEALLAVVAGLASGKFVIARD